MSGDLSLGNGVWAAVGIAVGGILGWLIEHCHKIAQISKLRAEVVKLSGENLEKVQHYRRAYYDLAAQVADAANALHQSIVKLDPPDRLGELRNAACSAFLDKALPAFVDWMEWVNLVGTPQDRYRLIIHQIDHELGLFSDWLLTLNHPLLVICTEQKTPARIFPVRLGCLHSIVDRLPKEYRQDADATLVNALEKLPSAGKAQGASEEEISAFLAARKQALIQIAELPKAD